MWRKKARRMTSLLIIFAMILSTVPSGFVYGKPIPNPTYETQKNVDIMLCVDKTTTNYMTVLKGTYLKNLNTYFGDNSITARWGLTSFDAVGSTVVDFTGDFATFSAAIPTVAGSNTGTYTMKEAVTAAKAKIVEQSSYPSGKILLVVTNKATPIPATDTIFTELQTANIVTYIVSNDTDGLYSSVLNGGASKKLGSSYIGIMNACYDTADTGGTVTNNPGTIFGAVRGNMEPHIKTIDYSDNGIQGESVSLECTIEAGEDITCYKWEYISPNVLEEQQAISGNSATVSFTPESVGSYLVILTVVDKFGGKSVTTMTVPVYSSDGAWCSATSQYTVPGAATNGMMVKWGVQGAMMNQNTYLLQKKDGAGIYQNVDVPKDKIRVLNIYPIENGEHLKTLKHWMETEEYGRDLMIVDERSVSSFNANPNILSKDSVTKKWNYDVVFVGSSDCNSNNDATSNSIGVIKEFVKDGNGLLLGHDTVAYSANFTGFSPINPNWNKLATELHFKGAPTKNNNGVTFSGSWTNPNGDTAWSAKNVTWQLWGGGNSDSAVSWESKVQAEKTGTLNAYPWDLTTLPSITNVKSTHTNWMNTFGDVWFKFTNNQKSQFNSNYGFYEWRNNLKGSGYTSSNNKRKELLQYWENNEAPATSISKANWYLTTWSNIAMIQTGHCITSSTYNSRSIAGLATEAEKKIIANTIYYLAPMATQYLDKDVKDNKAPNAVQAINPIKDEDIEVVNDNTKKVTVRFNNPEDNGNDYTYMVTATPRQSSGSNRTFETTEIYKSDVDYYKYYIDNNRTAVNVAKFDSDYNLVHESQRGILPAGTVDRRTSFMTGNLTVGEEYWLHIRTFDKQGNVSNENIKAIKINFSGSCDFDLGDALTDRVTAANKRLDSGIVDDRNRYFIGAEVISKITISNDGADLAKKYRITFNANAGLIRNYSVDINDLKILAYQIGDQDVAPLITTGLITELDATGEIVNLTIDNMDLTDGIAEDVTVYFSYRVELDSSYTLDSMDELLENEVFLEAWYADDSDITVGGDTATNQITLRTVKGILQ